MEKDAEAVLTDLLKRVETLEAAVKAFQGRKPAAIPGYKVASFRDREGDVWTVQPDGHLALGALVRSYSYVVDVYGPLEPYAVAVEEAEQ